MKHHIENALYHFTTFEAAVKIVSSNKLLFGKAYRKNDIAEVYKEIYGNIDDNVAQSALKEYQYISFTQNGRLGKGFEIDALWGYYAEKGVGICLAFDRKTLIEQFKKQFRGNGWRSNICYNKHCTNACFIECDKNDNVHRLIYQNRQKLFFEKSVEWRHESEYRLLVKSANEESLDIHNSLKGIIICDHCSKKDKLSITDTIQYKVFSKLVGIDKLYHYHHCFGNKELYNHNDTELIYPILGKHIHI